MSEEYIIDRLKQLKVTLTDIQWIQEQLSFLERDENAVE